jgi:hypothetical protein
MNQHNEHEKIDELKSVISQAEDPLKAIHNVFKGRTALVISGGPSAKIWEEIYKTEAGHNPIIICVKEAIKLVKDKCNIHFLNTANLVKYKTHHNALTVMTHNSPSQPVYSKFDINFHIMDKLAGNPNYFLASKRNFECFTLENTGIYRPLGPGIMHESVIYTLVHMGFKRIVTVGWDIADDMGGNTHFNDQGTFFSDKLEYSTSKKSVITQLKLKLKNSHCLKKPVFKAIRYPSYFLGKKINPALMFEGEAELVSSSLPQMKVWLESKEVSLQMHGGSKWIK